MANSIVEVYSSLREIQDALLTGELTCVSLVEGYLKAIEHKKHLNIYLEVYAEEAISRAKEIDRKIKTGTQGELAGMVVGLKDVFCYKDHHLQASSKILDNFVSQFDATCVNKMLMQDAIIIGRINCDEFAMGSSNENSAFGPVLNDIANDRVPGGSSGGSAVAVQAGTCLVALGSDTGGSVRQPASFTGTIGMKPTYGRISRYGLIAYASSFDTVGIISKSIEDNARTLSVIAGADEYDSTVSKKEVAQYHKSLNRKGKIKRVAYIRETLNHEGLNEEIRENVLETVASLKENGHLVEETEFPYLDYVLPTYYILTTAEASSNLSRYDGVRYGYRSNNVTDLESLFKKSRSEGFGDEVKRRILLGTFVLSASYYDAYYTKAQKARRVIKEKTEELLKDFEYIILPTSPTVAFKLGQKSNPLEMYLADLYTVQASVSGLPAISIPNGVDHQGLPIGLQIIGRHFDEAGLYAFANEILEYDKN